MWNCICLCELTDNTLHPITSYAIQLFVLFPQQKDFLANLKLQMAKAIFGIISLAKMGMVGLTC